MCDNKTCNQNNPINFNAFQQSPVFSKRVVITNEACQTGNYAALVSPNYNYKLEVW